MSKHNCAEGWICQKHPDKPFGHDVHELCTCGVPRFFCPGAAMLCADATCEFWPQTLPHISGVGTVTVGRD